MIIAIGIVNGALGLSAYILGWRDLMRGENDARAYGLGVLGSWLIASAAWLLWGDQ